jgi:hypothetical protein
MPNRAALGQQRSIRQFCVVQSGSLNRSSRYEQWFAVQRASLTLAE